VLFRSATYFDVMFFLETLIHRVQLWWRLFVGQVGIDCAEYYDLTQCPLVRERLGSVAPR
jgi:hypothetical protein